MGEGKGANDLQRCRRRMPPSRLEKREEKREHRGTRSLSSRVLSRLARERSLSFFHSRKLTVSKSTTWLGKKTRKNSSSRGASDPTEQALDGKAAAAAAAGALKKKREEEADENEKRRGKSALFLSLSLYYSCAFPLATHLISSCAVRGRKKRRRNRDMREREGRRMRVCSMLFFTFQQKGGARERA